jgi:dienelactone hydrolase
MTRKIIIAVIVLVDASLAFGQTGQAQPPKPDQPKATGEAQAVTFETTDGVKIAADYYAPATTADKKPPKAEKAPVAILVHMFPADRTSWEPLVPKLTDAGFAVLAYDIRGKGGSTEPVDKNLAKRYQEQSPDLFKDAWKDAEAAKKWLAGQPNCDVGRIVMVGASIGCSISLDYASRDEAVKAVVCLSPGTNYFGVDSIAHIEKCGKRAILLMSPTPEYAEVEKLVQASGGTAVGLKYHQRPAPEADARAQHGTNMFAAHYGEAVKDKIVKFVKKAVTPAAEKKDGHDEAGRKADVR